MKRWKQRLGSSATYNNLISAFERAGYKDYAEIVKGLLVKDVHTDSDDSDRIAHNQTPPLSSEQSLPQLPVFPEQVPEPPKFARAAKAKLRQPEEDDQLGI